MERNYDIEISFLNFVKEIVGSCPTIQKDVDLFLLNRLVHILENAPVPSAKVDQVEHQLEEDLENVSFYRPYYPFVRSFRAKGLIEDEPYNPTYSSIHISNNDTVSLVCDFFRDLGPQYEEDAIDFMDDADGHLKFIQPSSNNEGETTFIRTTGEFFCLVPDYSDFTKATILAHETTHIFDWYRNPDFLRAYLINEFNALFKEMLAADYFAKKLNLGDDNLKRRFSMHSLIKRYADDVFYRTQILHMFAQNGISSNKRSIYDIFGTEYLKYLTQDSLIENYVYQIAYLIAIELYTLYQSDRDKALWLANKIVSIGNNDNILEILSRHNINLNEHSLDYEKELKLSLGL